MKRRNFIKTGGLLGAAIATPAIALSQETPFDNQLIKDQQRVNFTRDGLDFTVREYSQLLSDIEEKDGIGVDSYSRGGVVEKLEKRMAEILGKESAVFMPTGTLANHIAIRKLAGEKRKVLVQSDSHIYRDSGDCANMLSGLNLIPLGKDKFDFDLTEVEEAIARTNAGRVNTEIGAISIESPVRRYNNQLFDFEHIQAISAYAKKNAIKMHLDGARLFNACVHTGKSPADYAELFDTVYVSLYKNFNATSGAILVGTKAFMKDLYHMRRMFGGGMPQVWPFAAVALHSLDGFLQSYKESLKQADKLFELLEKHPDIEISKIPQGSNVFQMKLRNKDVQKLKAVLETKNIYFPSANTKDGFIYFKINPSILRRPVKEIAELFLQTL